MLSVTGEGLVEVAQRASGIEMHVDGCRRDVAAGMARMDRPAQFVARYGRDAHSDLGQFRNIGPDSLTQFLSHAAQMAASTVFLTGTQSLTRDELNVLPGRSE